MVDLIVTQIIPDETEVTAEAINTPNNEQATAFNAHKNGSDYRHDSSAIDVEALNTGLTPDVTATDLETVLRRYAYGFLHAVNPDASSWASALLNLAVDENLHDNYVLLKNHSHTDATNGGKLSQASTHENVDTDASATAIHHTIGSGQFQAAAGNHLHDTRYILLTAINANSGVAGLSSTGFISDAQLSANIARQSSVDASVTTLNTSIAGKSVVGHTHGVNGEAAITSAGIAAGAVGTSQIADSAITALKIGAAAVTNSKMATDSVAAAQLQALSVSVTHLQDGAVSTSKLADGSVTTIKILDLNVTAAKIANGSIDDTKIVAGGLNTVSIKDGAITTGKIASYAVTRDKLFDGAITPTNPASFSIIINPLRKWNYLRKAVEYLGETRDLSVYIPGPGLRRYILVVVNSTGASDIVPGDPTGGTPTFPDKIPNTNGLGFVYLEYGMQAITAANIYPWIGISDDSNSGAGSGSPVGHVHGMSNEARILELGMDPGFPRPTATPSFQIIISGFRYRASNGQSKYYSGGLVGPFAAPATGQRIDAVYLDPATGTTTTLVGTPTTGTPVPPSFIGTQLSIAYVHNRAGQTYIGIADDGINGWIEDARNVLASGGGPGSINAVSTGGTGVASFTAGILVSTLGGANALSTIAMPTGTVVGTSDAQTLTSKTLSQSAATAIGTIFKQVASSTADLVQYLDSSNAAFGNVSRFQTFGFGALETIGGRKVLIGGSLTATNPHGLDINLSLVGTGAGQTYIGTNISPVVYAAGFTGQVALGTNIGLTRGGGDTGTFAATYAFQASAASFGAVNYAAVFNGATQVTGSFAVTAGLSVTGASALAGNTTVTGTLSATGDATFSARMSVATYCAYGGASLNGIIAQNIGGNYQYGINVATAPIIGASASSFGAQFAPVTTVSAGAAASGVYGLHVFPSVTLGSGASVGAGYGMLCYAPANCITTYAASFQGNVAVSGTLSKGGGTFHIDHPLDPTNTDLVHGFVEAPYYDLLYSDTVTLNNGKASVDVDAYARMRKGTLDALATRIRIFTTNETGWTPVRGSYKNGIVTIEAQDTTSADTVSWLVIGERQDAFVKSHLDPFTDANGRMQTEQPKPVNPDGRTGVDTFKGGYLYPEAFGKTRKPVIDPADVRKHINDNDVRNVDANPNNNGKNPVKVG